jgi:hypothetical protein
MPFAVLVSMMMQANTFRRFRSVTIVVILLMVFVLGFAAIGTKTAVASAAEADCPPPCDSTVLLGAAGNTLSLLAKEGFGLLRIGASTTATLGLALARNLDGIMLWINVVLVAVVAHMALVVAGASVLAVVKIRERRR